MFIYKGGKGPPPNSVVSWGGRSEGTALLECLGLVLGSEALTPGSKAGWTQLSTCWVLLRVRKLLYGVLRGEGVLRDGINTIGP